MTNKLYYGDNLEVLRERLADSPRTRTSVPVMKAARVETRVSHQQEAQGELL